MYLLTNPCITSSKDVIFANAFAVDSFSSSCFVLTVYRLPMSYSLIYIVVLYLQSTMNRSTVNLMDLPDEVLLTIWNKLNKLDVLYSFVGVNKRFHRLVCDVIYTRSVELISNDQNNDNCSLPAPMLERFCSRILPEIQQNIECLTLEPLSMECILHAGDYPRLWKLTLIKFDQKSSMHYFTSKKIICSLVQIESL